MSKKSVHIVGGGVIGLCAAWYLSKAGIQITVIDKNDFTEGTSFGNAGMIVPSHFVPMASPRIMAKGLKWLFNSKSPFYIRPRMDWAFIQWLWHFYQSANSRNVEYAMPILLEYHEKSKALFQEIAKDCQADIGMKEKGLLMLYRTVKQAKEEQELARQAKNIGLEARLLTKQDLATLEPNITSSASGGVYFPGDAHLHPNKLMHQLKKELIQRKIEFLGNTTIENFQISNGNLDALITRQGEKINVEQVLLASGSWTAQLLKKVGIKMYVQAGKGYSITLPCPKVAPSIPTILTEAKVAITPLGNELRIAGTLELSGLSRTINHNRVQGILDSLHHYYDNLEAPQAKTLHIWQGYRPCTPDGLPYLGHSKRYKNLFVATGHGMMGLSLGAATGKLCSDLITNQKLEMPIHAFSLDRFR